MANERQTQPDPGFENLLEFLKANRGFDFTGYKRPSLMRRVQKRLDALGIASFADYVDHLEVHPDEFEQLFDTILINVTTFLRDPPAWEILREKAVEIIAASQGDIRIWCAGCATGEEAYTVAMLFADALGHEAFVKRLKIYATDVDEDALNVGRHGTYTSKEMEAVPEESRERFFNKSGTRFVFHANLRRSIIFGRHDLVQDAPISRLDLIICRNTLMYLNAETQARVLANFHFGLNQDGFLFLGRAEMLLTHASLFSPVDDRARIFTRVSRPGLRDRLLAQVAPTAEEALADQQYVLRDAASDIAPVAQIVVDIEGMLLTANEQARALFGIVARDLGRPLQDLEVSYRPLELRSRIDRAYTERRPIVETSVERSYGNGGTQYLDVHVSPILGVDGSPLGANISFIDATRFWKLRMDLERSSQDLETAYEELQSTNEELETTNEELQSTIEELETTNEELQATNEELETMNEELQSTNAELHALNDELQKRTNDLDQLGAFSDSVLRSLRSALIVLDRGLRVHTWTERSEELWGLRSEEATGQSFVDLDIGLPVHELADVVKASLEEKDGPRRLSIAARDRRGREVMCAVTCSLLLDSGGRVQGVVLLMDVEPKPAKKR
jgi:two-component system, chemotaxis family, CheB/CheR fusion protein